ncbi:MAG TPA: (S)-benzoin forming benzil reductase [Bacteroidales bacterium]|nr:(S)-benzoin forming benzil reductase [Bacteroidales bacterium]
MKYIILTGSSKGLGEGIALALLKESHHLICISRTHNDHLQQLAEANNLTATQILFDLGFTDELPLLVTGIFEQIRVDVAKGVYLINNAGVIEPVNRSEYNTVGEIDRHLRINLMAPMVLSGAFIKHTCDWKIQKRILNISSGAAVNPYAGWSAYCSSKAGLNVFSSCVAQEQQNQQFPVEIMSVAPGIIDTRMQEVIRATTKEQFALRQKFVDFKESGQLEAPKMTGKKIAELLFSKDFVNGGFIDLRSKG